MTPNRRWNKLARQIPTSMLLPLSSTKAETAEPGLCSLRTTGKAEYSQAWDEKQGYFSTSVSLLMILTRPRRACICGVVGQRHESSSDEHRRTSGIESFKTLLTQPHDFDTKWHESYLNFSIPSFSLYYLRLNSGQISPSLTLLVHNHSSDTADSLTTEALQPRPPERPGAKAL